MEHVTFLVETTGERIDCLLNPERVVMRRQAGLLQHRTLGSDAEGSVEDLVIRTGGGHTEIELDLLFDLEITRQLSTISDVRELTSKIWALTERDEGYARAAAVRMFWGEDCNVRVVVDSLSERLDAFAETGAPRRAWLRARLIRIAEPARRSEQDVLQDPTPSEAPELALSELTDEAVSDGAQIATEAEELERAAALESGLWDWARQLGDENQAAAGDTEDGPDATGDDSTAEDSAAEDSAAEDGTADDDAAVDGTADGGPRDSDARPQATAGAASVAPAGGAVQARGAAPTAGARAAVTAVIADSEQRSNTAVEGSGSTFWQLALATPANVATRLASAVRETWNELLTAEAPEPAAVSTAAPPSVAAPAAASTRQASAQERSASLPATAARTASSGTAPPVSPARTASSGTPLPVIPEHTPSSGIPLPASPAHTASSGPALSVNVPPATPKSQAKAQSPTPVTQLKERYQRALADPREVSAQFAKYAEVLLTTAARSVKQAQAEHQRALECALQSLAAQNRSDAQQRELQTQQLKSSTEQLGQLTQQLQGLGQVEKQRQQQQASETALLTQISAAWQQGQRDHARHLEELLAQQQQLQKALTAATSALCAEPQGACLSATTNVLRKAAAAPLGATPNSDEEVAALTQLLAVKFSLSATLADVLQQLKDGTTSAADRAAARRTALSLLEEEQLGNAEVQSGVLEDAVTPRVAQVIRLDLLSYNRHGNAALWRHVARDVTPAHGSD